MGLPHLAVAVSSVRDSMCAGDPGPEQGQWDGTSPFHVSSGAYREMGALPTSWPRADSLG